MHSVCMKRNRKQDQKRKILFKVALTYSKSNKYIQHVVRNAKYEPESHENMYTTHKKKQKTRLENNKVRIQRNKIL